MPEQFQDYWDKNIDKWADKYLDISHGHETFDRSALFAALYNSTIGRLERRLMKERYLRTMDFLNRSLQPGMVFSDLGCGTGIFVVEAARRGASVNAVDFSKSSLEATRRTVEMHAPDAKVTYIQADLENVDLPQSDVTLAMGVTPYLTDIKAFITNALPKTAIMCVQYTDPDHWASRIRKTFPVLDVRSLQCYGQAEIQAIYLQHGGVLQSRKPFAFRLHRRSGELRSSIRRPQLARRAHRAFGAADVTETTSR